MWAGLLTIVALIILTASVTDVQQRFRILVTNDDGIETAGIHTLAESLRSVADEVVVVAPDGNRSGSSQAISGEPLVVREFWDGSRSLGYGVSGFPADAVRFGLIELGGDQGFDLVVSGINVGSNVGNVSHLSGTVGAAMEAIFQGVPAIAVSQEAGDTNYTLAARAWCSRSTSPREWPPSCAREVERAWGGAISGPCGTSDRTAPTIDARHTSVG